MKYLKIFVFLVIPVVFFVAVLDFSFLFINLPEEGKRILDMTKKAGEQVFISSPLKIEKGESFYLDEKKIIEETNRAREEYGMSPLSENSKLNASSLMKNEDMCKNQYFSHQLSSGGGPAKLASSAGYEFITIGENLAMGEFGDSKALVESWMESPEHRKNILGKNYREIGVSVMECDFEGKNIWLAVQHFGLPLSACPQIDEQVKKEIESNKEDLAFLKEKLERLQKEIKSFKVARDSYQKIEEYGSTVSQYNILIEKNEKLINEYNSQVKLFNECVGSFN